jgi:hypothetical protein
MPSFAISRNTYATLYAALVFVRFVFAFLGTGYIHPDEYFQNGEVTAGSYPYLYYSTILHLFAV